MTVSFSTEIFFGFFVTKEEILETFPGKFVNNKNESLEEIDFYLFEDFINSKGLRLNKSGNYRSGESLIYLISASKFIVVDGDDATTIPEIKVERKTRQRLKALAKKFGVSYGICVANSIS